MTTHDSELDMHIAVLNSPFGRDPDVRAREQAAEWLLAHADRSYPVLLERAGAGQAAAVELLGRFGRADAVPVLEGLLDDNGPTGMAAATALATHPHPAALAALRAGLARGGDHAVNCADALGARGDAAACPDLRDVIEGEDGDARLRYHALYAALRPGLACLSPDALAQIAEHDADPEVRELAARADAGS
ncbi:MAG: HEAT repeat domain-containing protein [Solirubrobacteraceae bacterium]